MPCFSIIVTCLNAEKTIATTIQSILAQTFTDYEIIVKDGESKDKTVSFVPQDSRIRIIVKKDKGIYEGMNQAILASNGKYCCFLNCGDTFWNDQVLENMDAFLQKNQNVNIAYGNYYTKGQFVQTPVKTTRFSIYRNPLCHQTMFIDRKLFDAYGLYKENMKILADYEFTVHCLNEGALCQNSGVTVCSYLGDGVSTQQKYRKIMQDESKRVKSSYFSVVERLKFNVLIACTFPRIRKYLASDKAPKLLHSLYNRMSNIAKRR